MIGQLSIICSNPVGVCLIYLHYCIFFSLLTAVQAKGTPLPINSNVIKYPVCNRMALYQVASVASLTIRSIGFVFGMELDFNMRVLSTSSSTL